MKMHRSKCFMTNWVATILIYSQTKVEKGLWITELAPIDSKGTAANNNLLEAIGEIPAINCLKLHYVNTSPI
jgi:hypothetical protein